MVRTLYSKSKDGQVRRTVNVSVRLTEAQVATVMRHNRYFVEKGHNINDILAMDLTHLILSLCGTCDGSGSINDNNDACTECDGSGKLCG